MKFEEKIKRKDNLKVKSPTIINIYNFIRKTVYPSGEFVQDDFECWWSPDNGSGIYGDEER